MPAVQHGFDRSKTTLKTTETARFLNHAQQQAIQANQAKIASLTFSIAPMPPWAALSVLGKRHQRHFYYDPPQQPAMVGLGVVVGCSTAGAARFAQAQKFIHLWQDQFIYAESRFAKGLFFCSATFFEETAEAIASPPAAAPICFDPAYVFVPQVLVTSQADVSTVTFNCLMTATTDLEETRARIDRQLKQLMTADLRADSADDLQTDPSAESLRNPAAASQKEVAKGVDNFEHTVRAVLRQIQAGQLHKVVLADVMDVVASQPVDVVRSLQTLRQNHPDCTVFSVGNGQGQSFIGASPERLLSITGGQLTTDALAGSASRGTTAELDAQLAYTLLHSDKERYEHRVVVEFLARQLRSLGLDPQYSAVPQLLQLLHIQHLHTPISAALSPQTIPPLDILAKLHPTPAVAGVPRRAACQLIGQHEAFDRGPYAAPLGWIDTQGNSEFIVGIRSALIDGCKARLYAGAGIVAGSEPAKELAEIKLKLQTLLSALV